MMKLKLKKNEKIGHTEMVCGVCWAPNNQLYSLGDDKIIYTWDTNGELVSKFVSFHQNLAVSLTFFWPFF